LKLPYVMGLDVLRWIRKQPGMILPVIVLSASGENAEVAAAYRLGANAFLRKPSKASQLEDMVKAIKDFWLTHNTLPQESSAESPMEGVVSLGYSTTTDFGPKPPAVNGVRRHELADAAEAIR